MERDGLTIYNQGGGFKSLGWNINNSILNSGLKSNFFIPAGLLYINNNFKSEHIKSFQKGVVNSDIYDKLYSFLDKSSNKNKTRKIKTKTKRRRKRKNKTKKYN